MAVAAVGEKNRFRQDVLRMILILFGPMLAGAMILPLLLLLFTFVGRQG
jgi:hypothetical protein